KLHDDAISEATPENAARRGIQMQNIFDEEVDNMIAQSL
ncbi:unnamed protein product, partial [Rotaria sordida]